MQLNTKSHFAPYKEERGQKKGLLCEENTGKEPLISYSLTWWKKKYELKNDFSHNCTSHNPFIVKFYF